MEKSLIQGRRLHDFPASQSNISILWGTFFSAPEHLFKQARQIAPRDNTRNVLDQYLLFTFIKVLNIVDRQT